MRRFIQAICIALLLAAPAAWGQDCYTSIPSYLSSTYVPNITITSEQTANAVRSAIIQHIFKQPTLPTGDPTTVQIGVPLSSGPLIAYPGAVSLNKYTTTHALAGGTFRRVAYHYIPAAPKSTVFFVHHGHANSFDGADGDQTGTTVRDLLSLGYSVITNYQPLFGEDTTTAPGWVMGIHEQFAAYDSPAYSPLRIFFEAEVLELNYAMNHLGYTDAKIVGLSGGGSHVSIWGAFDTRVSASFAVAGSYPLGLDRYGVYGGGNPGEGCYGRADFEWYRLSMVDAEDCTAAGTARYHGSASQTTSAPCCTGYHSGNCHVASYEDMYALSGSPAPRRGYQLHSQRDACCFYGLVWKLYERQVATAAQLAGGGRFQVFDFLGSGVDGCALGGASNCVPHNIHSLHRDVIHDDLAGTRWVDDGGYGVVLLGTGFVENRVAGVGLNYGFTSMGAGQSGTMLFSPPSLVPGTYNVYLSWPVAGGSTSIPYVVTADGLTALSGNLNQSGLPTQLGDLGATFNLLGQATTYSGSLFVQLSQPVTTPGAVRGDVARFQLVATVPAAGTPTPTPSVTPSFTWTPGVPPTPTGQPTRNATQGGPSCPVPG